ncbi:DUF4440 domain-containing protein [Shewanella sp. JM162201]|uniref:DUF4440 domain-containing protein n=1 Tax=Shewanella jiangmenensis TaxID=2837387 RepID=A0ABS5V672_9GAMM|nr:DUF4440 domain-containing protein [Shewanella jiangmenensis]MBT1445935.1 DUF4440 domain-containing protein [Shewanella jiangmenensis]
MRIFPLLLALLMSFAALASNANPTNGGQSAVDQSPVDQSQQSDDQAINRNYALFSQAFESLNPTIIGNIYTENACYIPERHDKEIIRGRNSIIAVYEKFFGKIRNKNARIEVDFRVIERSRSGDSATDVGYYLIRFYPASDTGEPISEYAGKFVTVAQKQDNGEWRLSLDSSNTAEPRFYFDAAKSGELYYGMAFQAMELKKKP